MIEHKMLHLFGGNMQAYGHDEGRAVHQPVTERLMLRHLEGTEGIGIYPMWHHNNMWWVKWGCCDIDTGDWSEAWGLTIALKAMGFTPFIERSRSKGWHIWVFSDGPVLARDMRRALKVAYAACDLQAREANPKAETLREGQLGNYVRLPFKGGLWSPQQRQTMMEEWDADSDGKPVCAAEWFANFEPGFRTDPRLVNEWASRWKEPERKRLEDPQVSVDELRILFDGMPPELFDFVANGPRGNGDRSEALVALAFKLKRAGYTPNQRYGIVVQADRRWGKYWERPDGEHYLAEIIERTM